MERMLVCLFVFVNCLDIVQGNVLLYSVTEEQQAGRFVGNIGRDGNLHNNLTAQVLNNLRYTLLPQRNPHIKLFSVDERSGVLQTTDRLDREVICGQAPMCHVNMSIGALSTINNFFTILNVSVQIIDINDNPPVFPNKNMQVTFSESAKVGDSFQIQEAVDQDIGINADISYVLQGSDGTFGLSNEKTPAGNTDLRVTVKRLLDHERFQQQHLTLVARDSGSPPNIATADIVIMITDINDHWPVFTEPVYELPILENTPVSTTLLQVKANDLDQGIHGEVSYHYPTLTAKSITDIFLLNSTSGDLVLQLPLDYESDMLYQFQVEGRDGGSPPKTAQATVIIKILDVNDNAPSITFNLLPEQTYITVPESLVPGDFVTQMSVFDGDSGKGGEVTCQLDGTQFQLVHVFGSEFKVLLNSTLDREMEPMVNLTVSCADQGSPPKQDVQTVNIRLEDVNDNAPQFPKQTYKLQIAENPTRGYAIMKASAHDMDSGENGKVTFKINATGEQYFQILNNGDIVVSSTLDHERTPLIVFDLIAKDNAEPFFSSTATVSVTILDENDEKPKFIPSSLRYTVSENLPADTPLGEVNATDPDTGLGGQVVYRLADEDGDVPFSIDPVSGLIKTKVTFDRELNSEYQFTVVALDKGTPEQTASALVTITVLDVNDNRPKLVFPNEINNTVKIYSSHKVGRVVTSVGAKDLDDKNNSLLEFSFKGNSNRYGFFSIDSDTGTITLSKSLSNRGKQTLELVVVARDHGSPRLSTESRLFIVVTMDNRPLPLPDGLAGRTNLTIAICILCVSAIVSGTIVIIICLVKRRGVKGPRETGKDEHVEKQPNSLYDSKKTNSADIIIPREGAAHSIQAVPAQIEKDDSMIFKVASNPTFQVFPVQDQYQPKMGYTDDFGKSDGQSNSSTGDSGRGLSQDDIQWVHQPQDLDHLHSLEEERFSQSSIPSHDHSGSDHMTRDYRWSGHMIHPHSAHPSPSGRSSRTSYHIGKISPSTASDYTSSYS